MLLVNLANMVSKINDKDKRRKKETYELMLREEKNNSEILKVYGV